jgi:hypothetical protein
MIDPDSWRTPCAAAALLLSPSPHQLRGFPIATLCCEPSAMTLTQLRYLVAISDAGLNITVAAERVHATSPGFPSSSSSSKANSVSSFSRARAKASPRSRRQAARSSSVRGSSSPKRGNVHAIAANLRGEEQGELTIATTHTQARFVLPKAIGALKSRYPAIVVHLQPQGDAQVMGLFEHGQADLAIISTAGTPPGEGLAVPLFRWRRTVAVPRAHALAICVAH